MQGAQPLNIKTNLKLSKLSKSETIQNLLTFSVIKATLELQMSACLSVRLSITKTAQPLRIMSSSIGFNHQSTSDFFLFLTSNCH